MENVSSSTPLIYSRIDGPSLRTSSPFSFTIVHFVGESVSPLFFQLTSHTIYRFCSYFKNICFSLEKTKKFYRKTRRFQAGKRCSVHFYPARKCWFRMESTGWCMEENMEETWTRQGKRMERRWAFAGGKTVKHDRDTPGERIVSQPVSRNRTKCE